MEQETKDKIKLDIIYLMYLIIGILLGMRTQMYLQQDNCNDECQRYINERDIEIEKYCGCSLTEIKARIDRGLILDASAFDIDLINKSVVMDSPS